MFDFRGIAAKALVHSASFGTTVANVRRPQPLPHVDLSLPAASLPPASFASQLALLPAQLAAPAAPAGMVTGAALPEVRAEMPLRTPAPPPTRGAPSTPHPESTRR
jgi:hypothetical protein